jgi:hypothetical protein
MLVIRPLATVRKVCGVQATQGIMRGNDFYFPKVADWRYEHEPTDPALIAQE